MTIRIDLIRQKADHTSQRRRHLGRTSCEVAGRRFETQGTAPIYKMLTLLWLHGHGGAAFEVHDDISPFGKPGGLAMRGKVRNWVRLVRGAPAFVSDAPAEAAFSPDERDLISRAAIGAVTIGPPPSENARGAAIRLPDGPWHPKGGDRASTALARPRPPEAA